MSTRKKRHLIAGTIIGGLLLAATTQTGNSFALSDTSSTSGSGPTTTTSQQTPNNSSDGTSPTAGDTPTTTTNSTTPKTGTSSTAGGATAAQTAGGNTGVTSTATTGSTPTTTSDPSTASSSGGIQPTTAQTDIDPVKPTLTNNTTDTNKVKSTAQTGDATVKNTATGGDAVTGNASAIATLVNTLASTSNLNGGNIPTATYNINGTQNGDIVINPEAILAAASTGNGPTPVTCAPGTTSAQNNATINNLVNLLAQSGNATVKNNGVGGDATSGNATTEADIVNMIQDLVSSKGAFLGVVNINGNLNGNINLPASDINALLTPTSGDGTAVGNSTAVNTANINNNVTLTARSGNAAVTNNGLPGTATSGNAKTVLNMNNIINCQIAGGNLLLVFVNVMGHWYGALLSEPAGTTTASLGGGITQDTVLPTSTTNAFNNSTINNNVHLTSISGNATVANNGAGGNATTGNATAIADVTNILGSQINLTGWLGILIINVFGTWNGSVGIQPTASTAPDAGNNGPAVPHGGAVQTGYAPHQALDNGYSYYIVNPPQSFDGGQFELASAHIPSANTQLPGSGSALGASIRPAAITTTNHTARSAKSVVADFILAGVGAALALTGGVTKLFVRRPQK